METEKTIEGFTYLISKSDKIIGIITANPQTIKFIFKPNIKHGK